MTSVDLLKILDDLNEDEFQRFKWYLQQPGFMKPDQYLKESALEKAKSLDTVKLMLKTFTLHGALEVTRKVLEEIPRNDLVQRLQDTISSPEDVTVLGVPVSSHQEKVEPAGDQRLEAGLRKYSCELTIDTNTVNTYLELSDNNRKVTGVMKKQTYPDHPDRFQDKPQLLCRTGLTGRCYWEVEWRGNVAIAVSYRGIRRRGNGRDCLFGRNDQSWSLDCSGEGYSVSHNDRTTPLISPSSSFLSSFFSSFSSSSGRVAVYVDCPAGSLSFYRVSSDTLIHLHTFSTTFTEPLYPGFRSWLGASVSLCSLEV